VINCKEIQDYIDLVYSNEYPACKEQKLMIKHIKKCFETENIYVDTEQLEKYLSLQKYFDYDLFPWEKFVFALHNCTYSAPGILRFPDLAMLVGRGAGKNGYMAFEDFALTTPINGIKNYDIDICATSEEQAKRSFKDIHNMLESHSKKMDKHFKWNLTEITNRKTNSVIRYRTSNAKTKDGGRPGKIDFDEYHAYENYKLIDVFKTGFGKIPMPRTTIATTMGDVRDGPLDHLLEDMLAILNGEIPDNGLLPFICRLDSKDEVHDKRNWYKANPSLQYFPELKRELEKEYRDYCRDHLGNSSFMTKRMNVVQGTSEEPVAEWADILITNREIIDLTDKPCVFGIDYMKTTDFLGIGLLFKIDNIKYWLSHSWVCENCRDLSRIRFPINGAAEKGLLTIVSGVEISPDIPAQWLSEKQEQYNIVGGALDSYRYSLLKNPLSELGYDADKKGKNNLKLVRPSDIMQIAPQITSDFANHRIIWGNNELMRWYTNNTKIIYDKKGNMLFGKIEPKTRKTDGFMAYVHSNTQLDLLEKYAPLPAELQERIFNVYTF
jgi:phage terminase large subunit-like protein